MLITSVYESVIHANTLLVLWQKKCLILLTHSSIPIFIFCLEVIQDFLIFFEIFLVEIYFLVSAFFTSLLKLLFLYIFLWSS